MCARFNRKLAATAKLVIYTVTMPIYDGVSKPALRFCEASSEV
ncbi:hypothetical protein BN134_2481 [Cronobacter dublinensis 1210]|uniref:Uncharacterized protein n=1 Tax=Cronobacter dublinensis 1210 TaxID=1208656 RepID=A0ABM9Q883_9ENTR|nr:hypothetical protein BN134_2481 [Cronobacter dublinensis 1210]